MMRVLSRYNHSLDMAKVVFKSQMVLEYIDAVLERKHQGNRCAEHLTSTVSPEFKLFDDELAHLWELSANAF